MSNPRPDPTQTPAFQQLQKEIRAFEGMKDELLRYYKGKHVIIKDSEFIGSFDTFHNAATEAVRRFKRGPYLIREVVEQERVHRLPSSAYHPLPSDH